MKTSTILRTLTGSLTAFVLFSCQKDPASPDENKVQNPWTDSVSISAGTGVAGFSDGNIKTAQFKNPKGLVLDASGNLYLADMGNQRIRKVSPDGTVRTLAGQTKAGYKDGADTTAMFNSPIDVALDAAGNIYVADYQNNRIRKISLNGTVSTVAGSATAGYADGSTDAALFSRPRSVAVDAAGNIYVADMANQRIRKISTSGVVSTLAGSGVKGFADGAGAVAQFNNPRDIVVDASGNVYVADADNNRIRKITPDGTVTTVAGEGTAGFAEGTRTTAQFNGPKGLAIDSKGDIYVADSENNRIRKIATDGTVTTIAGNGTAGYVEGSGLTAEFNKPRGIALSADGKVMYVSDEENSRIRKIAVQN